MRKTILTIAFLIPIFAFAQSVTIIPGGGIVEEIYDYKTDYVTPNDSLIKNHIYLQVPKSVKHYYPFHIQIRDTSGNVTSEAYYDMVNKKGVLKGDVQTILFCLAEIISNTAYTEQRHGFIGQTDFKNNNAKHEKNIDSSTGSN